MNNRFGLTEETLQKITGTLSKFPEIDEAIIYGSRAKGNFRPGSDIDLTLKGSQLDLTKLLRIDTALDDLLLPYKFDLSVYEKITDTPFLEHIARVGQSFYKK